MSNFWLTECKKSGILITLVSRTIPLPRGMGMPKNFKSLIIYWSELFIFYLKRIITSSFTLVIVWFIED